MAGHRDDSLAPDGACPETETLSFQDAVGEGEGGAIRAMMSATEVGRLKRKPWPWVQPVSRTNASCSGVSIPSAMVFMPQWLAMKTMVLTSEAFSEEAFGPDTNDLSILTVSRG